MEALSDTTWDVVICGTGIRQSILALALSRSRKKVLHIDRNNYYGGTEAAFSLQDASIWLHDSRNASRPASAIEPISLWTNSYSDKLGASRSYTLTLSPHLIYSQSALLPALVSSHLHTQLEFQAVGPWWICKDGLKRASHSEGQNSDEINSQGAQSRSGSQANVTLQKIPSTREDVFADDTLAPRDKRSLMKFLRSVVIEPVSEAAPSQAAPLSSTMTTLSSVVPKLHQSLLALSLSYDSAGAIKSRSLATRIRRHMMSIGAFGPGFGAVMPKYGGGAEVAQVACRASAVGGAVYVLGRGLKKISDSNEYSAEVGATPADVIHLELSDGEETKGRLVSGCAEDFPPDMTKETTRNSNGALVKTLHSVSIVSSPLEHLFPPTSENGPVPAGAVVVYGGDDGNKAKYQDGPVSPNAPTYMVVHSSESGECPHGQCVIYSSTLAFPRGDDEVDLHRLDVAIGRLLEALTVSDSKPEVLWSLKYRAKGRPTDSEAGPVLSSMSGKVMMFPPRSIDLVFDDSILENVKEVWKRIMGDEVDDSDFLKFEDRGVEGEDGS